MKKYAIYFEDYPTQPMICNAMNKTDARAAGNLYNRQWQLGTKIARIEEVPQS